jgi:hypothetical protein
VSSPGWEVVHLLVTMHEVHEPLMVVVVVLALWGIHGQQQVVGAQAMTLSVCIGEDASLQQLVITVAHTCMRNTLIVTNGPS